VSTDPTPTPDPSKWKRYAGYAWRIVAALLPVAAFIAGAEGCSQTKTVIEYVDRFVEVPKPIPPEEFIPTTGWVRDEDQIAANLDQGQTLHFSQTPAGRAASAESDVFLWRAVRKAAGKPDGWYPNVNQQSVGCCVGCGFKHGADIVQATAILSGAKFEWKPVSVEVIYAGSRVEVGGGRISGDGSVGAWAAAWVRERGGLVSMENHAAADLTTFDPSRARSWGRTGVPDALEPLARMHPVKGCALVTSWPDVKRSIQQGYPVAVCSNQGFRMQRDSSGRCSPQGSWAHCMCICGVRVAADGRPEAGFILNSWGDNAHTGPVWPPDMPTCGFWADSAVIDRMVRQGDSFALADVAGFPARKVVPDWFVELRPHRPEFVPFKNEVALCW
jgi:hypothetical protein